jgi:hypothetical protein
MKDLIYIFVSSFIGSGVAGVLLYFVITKWLGTRIEQSIKHEYDRALEEFKTNLVLEQNELISKRAREISTDSKLLAEFLHDFPPGGQMQRIRNASGRIFDVHITDLLDRLINIWELVDHCFLDTDVNKALDILIAQAQVFANELVTCTFPIPDKPDKYEIPPEWKTQDYENYQKVLKMIYAYRDHFVKAYDEFVRIARSKLNCAS